MRNKSVDESATLDAGATVFGQALVASQGDVLDDLFGSSDPSRWILLDGAD